MYVRAKIVIQTLALHTGNNLITYHKGTNVRTGRFFDKILHQKAHTFYIKCLHYSLGGLASLSQHYTIAVCSTSHLDNHRDTASFFNDIVKVSRLTGKNRFGYANSGFGH